MTLTLGHIRDALEGAIPAVMATCSADGTPNVAFLSQVHYVDETHVALSYQFFNKTRHNILANGQGQLTVVNPHTAQLFRMRLRYLRTESEGPLFERMRAHLEGIASHTGMAGVFRLLGSDVYEVNELEALPGATLPPPPAACNLLAALRRSSEAVAACTDFAALVETALDALVREFGIEHSLFLMFDAAGDRLYTVGSRGYSTSGVGSEIALGDGVIGVCAQAKTPIRIGWLTQAYRYSQAIRDSTFPGGGGAELRTEIAYPGLADPHSQLGLPMLRAGRLIGVLFVESNQDMRFAYDHEDALLCLAGQVAASIDALPDVLEKASNSAPECASQDATPALQEPKPLGSPIQVRHYGGNNIIFLGDDYLIKGVAGAIFWRVMSEYCGKGRTQFSNRELRLDPLIGLPDVVDNLEARLILLRRRLCEQAAGIELLKSGRGRLQLAVTRPVELVELNGG
jgi:adenylate cyclase